MEATTYPFSAASREDNRRMPLILMDPISCLQCLQIILFLKDHICKLTPVLLKTASH